MPTTDLQHQQQALLAQISEAQQQAATAEALQEQLREVNQRIAVQNQLAATQELRQQQDDLVTEATDLAGEINDLSQELREKLSRFAELSVRINALERDITGQAKRIRVDTTIPAPNTLPLIHVPTDPGGCIQAHSFESWRSMPQQHVPTQVKEIW